MPSGGAEVLPDKLFGQSTARERLEREAQAASALKHSHIYTVYDIGEHEGQPRGLAPWDQNHLALLRTQMSGQPQW